MNNTLSKEIEKIIEDCKDVDYGEDSVTLMFYDAKAIKQLLQLIQQESIGFFKWTMRNDVDLDLPSETLYQQYLLHKQNKEQ